MTGYLTMRGKVSTLEDSNTQHATAATMLANAWHDERGSPGRSFASAMMTALNTIATIAALRRRR